MSKFISRGTVCAAVLFFVTWASVQAQTFRERIASDRALAGGVYHPYRYGSLDDTPAPKGYKAFYVSHFGRHGSRYHTDYGYFKAALDGLTAAESEGNLTAEGAALLEDIRTVAKASEKMDGALSPLGGREHQEIARRMSARFPDVFKSKDRREVECVSSTIPRCIVSMANFTQALAALHPELEFESFSSQRHFEYIMKESSYHDEVSLGAKHLTDSLRKVRCSSDKLFKTVFKDVEKAHESVGSASKFIYSVYMAASICPDLDFTGVDMMKYFDLDELCAQAEVRCARMYCMYANSAEYGEKNIRAADDLLRDFVTKADAALAPDGRRAADLRFGHDTGLLPLAGLIGIKEMAVRYPTDGCWEHWATCDRIPMASNLQMVFYRSKKGDVLVKLLYNEQETVIPALEPFSGPYYRWEELREYLLSRIQEY
ncbi:MAG: histidine-type phosphatase [Candidatus Cryptobacteroides sp.]